MGAAQRVTACCHDVRRMLVQCTCIIISTLACADAFGAPYSVAYGILARDRACGLRQPTVPHAPVRCGAAMMAKVGQFP